MLEIPLHNNNDYHNLIKLNFVVGESEFELFMTGQVYPTYFLFANNGNHPNLISLSALSEIKKLRKIRYHLHRSQDIISLHTKG